MSILIAHHISSHFVHDWSQCSDQTMNTLSYAANLRILSALEGVNRQTFENEGGGNFELAADPLRSHQIRAVINIAAKLHVDRSIHGPDEFIQ